MMEDYEFDGYGEITPDIICNSNEVDCKKVVKWLHDFKYSCNEIFIEDSNLLINRFEDEEVAYDFMEEGYIGKTREIEYPPFCQILVEPDLIRENIGDLDEYVDDQVIISVLHEEAHVRGIDDEREAENWAYKRYKHDSVSFPANLYRDPALL